jgi:subtilisin-like proprotein convertase family protein
VNYYVDGDSDTYGAGAATKSCTAIAGSVLNNTDCDDAAASVYPGAPELCGNSSVDNDCDGNASEIDAGASDKVAFYTDADGDAFTLSTGANFCPGTTNAGFRSAQSDPLDCNDAAATVYPGAPETCANDGIDNDCDGESNSDAEASDSVNYYVDGDSDGYGAGAATKSCTAIAGSVTNNTDCNDSNAAISPATVWYQDADADGAGDPNVTLVQCAQPSGYILVAGDACPTVASRTSPATWYPDADGDGFGAPSPTQSACTQPAGHVLVDSDCNDSNAAINPTTVWYQDSDGDGAGNPSVTLTQCAQPSGYVLAAGDNCPNDANKTAPGTCGCGTPDTDSDGDGTADCNDTTYSYALTGGNIPDNSATGLSKTFSVTSGQLPNGFTNIRVTLTGLTHTWVGDVTATLTAPNGTTVSLFTRIGVTAGAANGDDSDFGGTYVFDDAFTSSLWTAASAVAASGVVAPGNYFPSVGATGAKTPLTAPMIGSNIYGTWTLKLTDSVTADTGSIASARIDFTPAAAGDSDGDGVGNGFDGCPNDANKTAPGTCGCGTPDTDSDADGTPDCNDPLYTYPLAGGSVPDNSATGLVRTFTVAQGQFFYGITDVRVTLSGLTHANCGDITATLTNPAGTTVSLFTRLGATSAGGAGDSSNFGGNYAFFDAATSSLWTAAQSGANNTVLASGNYFPSAALTGSRVNLTGSFAGGQLAGTWTLRISDTVASNAGSITGASVEFDPGDPVDSDGDGFFDGDDGCPNDPNKITPGQCGCGQIDLDTDGDTVADCVDDCPNDAGKTAPGQCGCGTPDTDSDGDGTADCNDGCPSDPNKTSAGSCGCGSPDTDGDGNGTADCLETTPAVSATVLGGGTEFAAADTIVVRIAYTNPAQVVATARLSLSYSTASLIPIEVRAPTGSSFTQNASTVINFDSGTIRYEVSAAGASGGANVADIEFAVLPGANACATSGLVGFTTIAGQSTQLVRVDGAAVAVGTGPLGAIRVDGLGPVLSGVPASSTRSVDAGSTVGAVVSAPTATASDNCDGARSVDLEITYPDASVATEWPIGGVFPIGVTEVRFSSVDSLGNETTTTRTIEVLDQHLLDIDLSLVGTIVGNPSRNIRVQVGETIQVASVGFSGASGSVASLAIPVAASHPCVRIKDAGFSLSQTSGTSVSGVKYAATASLRQGDSNDDDRVDILDFALFVASRGSTVGVSARSNFNADAVVNNADLSFISLHYFQVGATCSGAFDGGAPIERIRVKDLRRLGLGEAAIADLDGDGWVGPADIAHYLQHGAPPPWGASGDKVR